MSRKLHVCITTALLLLALTSLAIGTTSEVAAAECTWAGQTSSWSDSRNWSGCVPQSFNTVRIPGSVSIYPVITATDGGAVTLAGVTLESGASLWLTDKGASLTLQGSSSNAGTIGITTDAALILASGALTNDSTIQVDPSGIFYFDAGEINGTGSIDIAATNVEQADGRLELRSSSTKSLKGLAINNSGTINWVAGDLYFYANARLTNNDTGTFKMYGGYLWNSDPAAALQPSINNSGKLEKLGTGTVYNYIALSNSSTLDVQGGTFWFYSGGALNASYTTALNSFLILDGSDKIYSINSGSSFVGEGFVKLNSAVLSVDVSADLPVSIPKFEFASGTIKGSGNLQITSQLKWLGGTMEGDPAATDDAVTVASGATLNIGSSGSKSIEGRSLVNAGTGTWSGGDLYLYPGGVLDNRGTLTAQAGGTIYNYASSTEIQAAINNSGRLIKTGTNTSTTSYVPFNNSNPLATAVDVQSGNLMLAGGGSSTGGFTIAAGSVLEFLGGGKIFSLNSGSAFAGAGTAKVNGGTLSLTAAVSMPRLQLSSGLITGDANLQVTSALIWTGGTMEGDPLGSIDAVTVASGATLTISGLASKTIEGRSLVNAGTGTWNGGDLYLYPGALFNNNGTLTVQAGGAIYNYASSTEIQPAINNSGRLIKTGTDTTSTSYVPFNNSNPLATAVDLQSGNLMLAGGGSSTGGFTIAAGSVLEFLGGGKIFSLNSGSAFAGAGTAKVNGATLSLTAAVSMPRLQLSSGLITGDANLQVTSALIWTGGTMEGDPLGSIDAVTVASGATLTISGLASKTIEGRSLVNAGTGTWSGGDLYLDAGALFNNSGTLTAQAGGAIYNYASSTEIQPAINNSGRLVKTGIGTTTLSYVVFNNNNSAANAVTIESGNLKLAGGGGSTGGFSIAPGTTLELAGSNRFSLNTGASFGGPAGVKPGLVKLNGATLVVNATTVGIYNVELLNGTLAGPGELNVLGLLSWIDGTMEGPGSTSIASDAHMVLSSSNWKSLVGRTLKNYGTLVWKDTGSISASDGASLINERGGVFNVLSSLGFYSSGSPTSALINRGLLNPGGAAYVTLTISGNFVQEAGALLHMELGGAADTERDLLDINGSAELGGQLNLQIMNGFVAQAGQSFTLINADAVSAAFGSFTNNGTQQNYRPGYTTTAVSVGLAQTTEVHVVKVTPSSGRNTQQHVITVEGFNFKTGVKVQLVAPTNPPRVVELSGVTLQSSTSLLATVPVGLAPGTYHLGVINTDSNGHMLANAYTALSADPVSLTHVVPGSVSNSYPAVIDVFGSNIPPGSTLAIKLSSGGTSIQLRFTNFIDHTHLRSVVPSGLPPGSYTLTLTTSDSRTVSLAQALKIVDGALLKDLTAESHDLFTLPHTPHNGQQVQVGLVLRHFANEGSANVSQVTVHFSVGAPPGQTGAVELGQVTVSDIAANNFRISPTVRWSAKTGTYVLYALIDKANQVSEGPNEVQEQNNLIEREIRVLPAPSDTTPPQITSFQINDGATETASQQITLDTVASDSGTGVHSILYVEYDFDQSVGLRRVRDSGWLAYESAASDYPWELSATPGTHFLQVFVSDAQGNVSSTPQSAFINLLPGESQLLRDQVHYKRVEVPANQSVQLSVSTTGGFVDLLVYNAAGELYYGDENDTASKSVVLSAGSSLTVFHIAVAGYSAETSYSLVLVPVPTTSVAAKAAGIQAVEGRPRSSTFRVGDPDPEIGLPTAPTSSGQIYIPLLKR